VKPTDCDAPSASEDETAAALSAAPVTGDGGRAEDVAEGLSIRSTVFSSDASMEASACFQLVSRARRPSFLFTALAAGGTVGVGTFMATSASAADATAEAKSAAEGGPAADTAEDGVDAAADDPVSETCANAEAAAAAEGGAATETSRVCVNPDDAATTEEPGSTTETTVDADAVTEEVFAGVRVDEATANAAADNGIATGGITVQGRSPRIVKFFSSATPPVPETAAS